MLVDIKRSTEAQDDSSLSGKKARKMKREPFLVDYMNLQDIESTAFAPPKNQRSLLLAPSNSFIETILPEDCHYHPEELIRLFVLPSILVLP